MNTDTRPDRPADAGDGDRSTADELEALRRLESAIEAAADDPIYPALRAWQEARLGEIEALRTYAQLEAEEGDQEDGAATLPLLNGDHRRCLAESAKATKCSRHSAATASSRRIGGAS